MPALGDTIPRLAFDHPADGRRMQLDSPLVADLERLVSVLRGAPSAGSP